MLSDEQAEALIAERDIGPASFFRRSEVSGSSSASESLEESSEPVTLRVSASPPLAPGKSVPAQLLVTLPGSSTVRTVAESAVTSDGTLTLSLSHMPEQISAGQEVALADEAEWSSPLSSEAPISRSRRTRLGLSAKSRGMRFVPRRRLVLIPRSGDELLHVDGERRCEVEDVDEGPTVTVYWS